MSTPYPGVSSNNPATIPVLDDGDEPEAATWGPALEGLMDKIVHTQEGATVFDGVKNFQDEIVVSTGGDDAEAGIAIGLGGERKLLVRGLLSSSPIMQARIYVRKREGTILGGFEITENAVWDSVSNTWDFDTLTTASTIEGARMIELLSTAGHGVADNATGFSHRMKKLHIMSGAPSDLDFDAGADTITRNTGSWVTDGFAIGDVIKITGTVSNNGNHIVTAVSATVLTVGNTLVTESNVNGAGVVIRTAPWAETAWDSQHLGFSARVTVPTQAGLRKNTLYPGNLLKARGRYSVVGGVVTINDGFGLVSGTIVGSNAQFTLRNAMVTGYTVQASSLTAAARVAEGREISTTVVEVRLFTNADLTVEHDQSTLNASGTFTVWGDQA